LHEKDDSRIGYEKACKKVGKPVPDDEIVRGYEVSEGEYVYEALRTLHVEPEPECEEPTDLLEALRASVEAHSRNGRRAKRGQRVADRAQSPGARAARRQGRHPRGRSKMTKKELAKALEAA
jgi:non-homologous end joining protein Ku